MTGREEGRTLYLLPDEAGRLIKAAATHIKPLLIFMLGSGARMSEAMELDWREVKLGAAKVQFLKTKQRKRRVAHMPPAVVAALAKLSHREGPVFRRPDGRPYVDRERRYGGQIKTAWCGAIRRAGLDPELRPHDIRHTWASWHYAIHKDLLLLKDEGAWSTVTLVTRYAHKIDDGHAAAIRTFWQLSGIGTDAVVATV